MTERQAPLFLEDRTRYLVKHQGNIAECWYMGGLFVFDSYGIAKEVEVLERLGNEQERFDTRTTKRTRPLEVSS